MAKEIKNNHMVGFFKNIEPTLENMTSIAHFNRIVNNYLKIIKLLTTNKNAK